MPKDEEGGAGLRAAPSYGELDRKKEEWVDTPAQTKRIVILGGGFGGLYAALYLDRTVARDPGIEVILIDPQNFALFTPMLHEVASGTLDPSSIVVPIPTNITRTSPMCLTASSPMARFSTACCRTRALAPTSNARTRCVVAPP